MEYIISFLEGIITFVSPCLLPMLPIYISYFAGNMSEETAAKDDKKQTRRTFINALGFVLGFSTVFIVMGAFAGTIGKLLRQYQTAVNLVSGLLVIIFGLNFLGIFRMQIFGRSQKRGMQTENMGFFSAFLFGMIFSIGWTPCVGAFLGSALMLASQQGSAIKGVMMLFFYSLGLGIPFLVSAVLIEKLKTTFTFIKKHYTIINKAAGILLIIVGVLMATGYMGYFLSLLTF